MIACSDRSQFNKVDHNAGQYKGGGLAVRAEKLIRYGERLNYD